MRVLVSVPPLTPCPQEACLWVFKGVHRDNLLQRVPRFVHSQDVLGLGLVVDGVLNHTVYRRCSCVYKKYVCKCVMWILSGRAKSPGEVVYMNHGNLVLAGAKEWKVIKRLGPGRLSK